MLKCGEKVHHLVARPAPFRSEVNPREAALQIRLTTHSETVLASSNIASKVRRSDPRQLGANQNFGMGDQFSFIQTREQAASTGAAKRRLILSMTMELTSASAFSMRATISSAMVASVQISALIRSPNLRQDFLKMKVNFEK
jgi:hypothetical protein